MVERDAGEFESGWRRGLRTGARAIVACGFVGGLASCSVALDFQQCVSDADCVGREGAEGGGAVCHVDGYCAAADDDGGPSGQAPRVGFVYVGPVGDHGWTKTHDDSRLYLEEQIPGIATFFEPLVTPSRAPDVIRTFIEDEGANLVIGTSFDFKGAIQEAAANNPDVNFLICSGFVSGPNLGSYFARMYMPKWLAGRLAGQMTTTNKIGIVGSVVIPETVRHVNAFTLGVKSVNPDAVVMVRWVHEWFDIEAEEAATQELIDSGADFLISGTDTPTALTVADGQTTPDGAPVYTVGYDNPDTCKFAPDTCLTSIYYNWGPMVEDIVDHIGDGTWDPSVPVWEPMRGDSARSGAYVAPLNEDIVPVATIFDIEEQLAALASEQTVVFGGSLVDNTGATRLGGAVPEDSDLLEMCWFVDGVMEPGAKDNVPAVVPGGCGGVY